MLADALTALAAAAGTAVVQAAGTDAWAGLRSQVAKWFGRGGTQREQSALDRLDQAAAALEAAEPGESDWVRARQEVAWQTRFETVLEGLEGMEQQRAAVALRDLLGTLAYGRATAVGNNAVAVAGDVTIHAETGGAAAWWMRTVQTAYPPGGPAEAADPRQPGRSSG